MTDRAEEARALLERLDAATEAVKDRWTSWKLPRDEDDFVLSTYAGVVDRVRAYLASGEPIRPVMANVIAAGDMMVRGIEAEGAEGRQPPTAPLRSALWMRRYSRIWAAWPAATAEEVPAVPTIAGLRAEKCRHCDHLKEQHSVGCQQYDCPCLARHKDWHDAFEKAKEAASHD